MRRLQLAADVERYAELGAQTPCRPPQLGADRRARQLRSRRALLRLPDHGAAGPPRHVAADVAGHAVPVAAGTRDGLAIAILAIGPEPGPDRADRAISATAARAPWPSSTTPPRRWPQAAEWVLPLHAGAETSVAATKSFIASWWPARAWSRTGRTTPSCRRRWTRCPRRCERAARADWSAALDVLAPAPQAHRDRPRHQPRDRDGSGAQVQGNLGIQAEAFCGAEIKHGPMALIDDGYPLLIFAPRGPAQAGLLAAGRRNARTRRARAAGRAGRRARTRPDRCRSPATPDLDPIVGDPELLPDGRAAVERARPRSGPAAPPEQGHLTH